MITVLLPPGPRAPGEAVVLEPAEVHHLRVRRAGETTPVQLRNGHGLVGAGILRQRHHTVEAVVEQLELVARPAPLRLAVAAGDRDRFAWLVEKATELGVTDIFPLETGRTAAVASRIRAGQLGRLRRRALEAVKQCGAAWAPTIHPTERLDAFLGRALDGDRWLTDALGDPPPTGFGRQSVTVVVGPEGGLSCDERAAAVSAGFRPVRLGGNTLRFETAALAAAACVAAMRGGGANG